MNNTQRKSNDLNHIIITGRLCADPTTRQLDNEKKTQLTQFTIANQTFLAKETSFIHCQAFGKTAKYISEYIHKGNSVLIEGSLVIVSYKDKDSNPKSFTNINVLSIRPYNILPVEHSQQEQAQAPEIDNSLLEDYDAEELPF